VAGKKHAFREACASTYFDFAIFPKNYEFWRKVILAPEHQCSRHITKFKNLYLQVSKNYETKL
jgi:hypothetical protein